jgi:hypothetical protein
MDYVLKLADASIAAGVLGKLCESGPQWLIAPLDQPLEASVQIAQERGYYFCGTLAYLSGRCLAAVEQDDPERCAVIAAAIPAFCQLASERIKSEEDRGWVEWLKNLWSLSDTREN